jgi:hypothetical protein
MLVWGIVLFVLGVLAFLDSQFNYGYLFRSANSILFMLVSLGVLFRTRILEKLGFKERLIEQNDALKERVMELKKEQGQTEEKHQEVTV